MTAPTHPCDRRPDVSVLMAVFNGEKYVRLAIDSVVSQDFENFELVIVDDCSSDGTASIIHSYGDPRIVYLRNQANLGQTRSLNVALAHARADLIARIDADDVFLPGKITRQHAFMTAHPEVAVCGTSAMRIDAEGLETGVNRLPSDPLDIRFRALHTVPVCHVSVMMRTSAIAACGGYPEQYRYAADFALWSQMLSTSQVITNLPDVLVQYREFGETFGAAQKVGAAGAESAEIIGANVRALTRLELTGDECLDIALLYFPAAGTSIGDLCAACLNLRRLAVDVYGRVPAPVMRALSGALFWAVTKRLAFMHRRQEPARGQIATALRRFIGHPDITAVVLAGAVAARLGEQRIVKIKEFVLLQDQGIRSAALGAPPLIARRLVRKFRRLVVLLGQAGPRRVAHVLSVSYLLPLVMEGLAVFEPLHPRLKKLWQLARAPSDIRRYRRLKDEVIRVGTSGYRLPVDKFGLEPAELEAVRARLTSHSEVVLAEIDQDGLLLSHFGPIEGARTVEASDFLPRTRFSLSVVTVGEVVGVRKQFRRDRLSFVTELHALHRLGAAGCRVPAILDVNFDALSITFSYIKGKELRLELADRGAALLDRVILRAPGYDALSGAQRRAQQIDEGRPRLAEVVDESYVEQVFDQVRRMHRAGFIWKDIKYGNMLIATETGEPCVIDFDTTYDHSATNPFLFRLLADRNIEELNRCFGTAKLTYRRIKDQLARETGKKHGYSPAYFGYGLRSGALLKNYVGDGRWEFIMRTHVPPLKGARILDLGSNDAFHSLQCLRHGAAQAIAIERNPDAIARGLWFRDAFEWSDNRRYDFHYVQTDMAQVPEAGLGTFDFAMALCSIYYLDDRGIADLIAYLGTVTDTLLLMCNTEEDIGRTNRQEYIKASVPYTVAAMADNGFPATTVIAPANYSRPLVIGRKRAAA